MKFVLFISTITKCVFQIRDFLTCVDDASIMPIKSKTNRPTKKKIMIGKENRTTEKEQKLEKEQNV